LDQFIKEKVCTNELTTSWFINFFTQGDFVMTNQQILPELSVQLKKLGLSGMLNSLPDRNKEAITNQMAYPEFLSLLVQDEILLREHRRYQRRYQNAGFRGEKTLENFDFDFNQKINQKLVRDLATCHFIREKYPVIIVGPCGTGKTHLAQALGFCAIQKGHDVYCTKQTELSDELQGAKACGQYSKKLKMLSKIKLLIIDDFGLKPLLPSQEEVLHDLISERYELSSTIITSNLAVSEWHEAFTNKLLGSATIDRLRHNAYELELDGKSYRSVCKNSKTLR
jgi:DNA replication protein DnaC